jgi:hypothetical protein
MGAFCLANGDNDEAVGRDCDVLRYFESHMVAVAANDFITLPLCEAPYWRRFRLRYKRAIIESRRQTEGHFKSSLVV